MNLFPLIYRSAYSLGRFGSAWRIKFFALSLSMYDPNEMMRYCVLGVVCTESSRACLTGPLVSAVSQGVLSATAPQIVDSKASEPATPISWPGWSDPLFVPTTCRLCVCLSVFLSGRSAVVVEAQHKMSVTEEDVKRMVEQKNYDRFLTQATRQDR